MSSVRDSRGVKEGFIIRVVTFQFMRRTWQGHLAGDDNVMGKTE